MSIELTMPRLSDTMESGTIIKWNVKEGDTVSSGAAVADVETDKATMEMQSFDDGVIAKILVPEGKLVPVGTVIALIAEEGEDPASIKASGGGEENGAAPQSSEKSEKSEKRSSDAKPSKQDARDDGAQEDAPEREARSESATKASARDDPDDADQENGKRSGERGPRRDTDSRSGDGRAVEPKSGSDGDAADDGRLRVSPVARRIADEHGVDVRGLRGSGPGGRVVKEDVLAAIERGPDAKAESDRARGGSKRDGSSTAAPAARTSRTEKPAERRDSSRSARSSAADLDRPVQEDDAPRLEPGLYPLSGMRQTIAKRLVESKTTIPHYQVTMRFDMDALMELRATLNRQLEVQGIKLSVNDFIVRACALAMHRHPEFNASWAGGEGVRVHGSVNVGIAISLPRERGGGLVVGVIRDADRKGLRRLSAESRELSERARGRGLSAEEMSDSTFTISNLGMFGVEHFTAIINPPNSAILAVGAALEQPVVRNGAIMVGHQMSATLSLDHRVIDGAMAAAYLGTLRELLENPAGLLV